MPEVTNGNMLKETTYSDRQLEKHCFIISSCFGVIAIAKIICQNIFSSSDLRY
jgi:hypothetical protein